MGGCNLVYVRRAHVRILVVVILLLLVVNCAVT